MIRCKGANFCARVNDYTWDAARDLMKSTEKEKIVKINSSHKSETKCNKLGISQESFYVRFIKIVLENGEKEILVTSLLDRELYPYEQFDQLYHERWFVEESFKLQK